MVHFATEFPIRCPSGKAEFVSLLVNWLRENSNSTVLGADAEKEFGLPMSLLISEIGEELRILEVDDQENWVALGFQHVIPDPQGRRWRTECVVRRIESATSVVRFRTDCMAIVANARVDVPRKPRLVKTLLRDGWGGEDRLLRVSDKPHNLAHSRDDLELAAMTIAGSATSFLPIVYLSYGSEFDGMFNPQIISQLAFDLGGVAHVIVEPNRRFSFELMPMVDGKNPYGGSVGLIGPGVGVVRRLHNDWGALEPSYLAAMVRDVATELSGRMAPKGWDWSELQEASIRQRLVNAGSGLTREEGEGLYKAQIKALNDQILRLKEELNTSKIEVSSADVSFDKGPRTGRVGSNDTSEYISNIVPELYAAELLDRIRFVAGWALKSADSIGLEKRSRHMLDTFLNATSASSAGAALARELDRAARADRKAIRSFIEILERIGYVQISDSRHIRMEPPNELGGLDSITLPKTPSDHRAAMNLKSTIEKVLGISRLY